MDIWGPALVEAYGKIRYLLTIVDDATRWVEMFEMKHKNDVFTEYVEFTTMLHTHHGIKVKFLQSDNDTCFLNHDFRDYTDSQGTQRRLTVHGHSVQNGVAEHMHQTILNGVRACLNASGLPPKLWGKATKYQIWIRNRSPSAAIGYKMPYFMRFKEDYIIKDLLEFSQWCVKKDEHKNKLLNHGTLGRWLGYDDESKGHLIWHNNKVTVECNVQFYDGKPPQVEGENNNDNNQVPELLPSGSGSQEDDSQYEEPELRQSTREKHPTKRSRGLNYDDESDLAIYLSEFNDFKNILDHDPVTFRDTINRSDRRLWYDTMSEEIATLRQRGTWGYAYPPKDTNIIGTKFVYKIKCKADGTIDKYKVQLVVQGFSQKEGVDFYEDDKYAPVTKLTAARTILSWAASNDYEIHQIDVKSAYLYGELNDNEIIYVRPSPGNFLKDIKPGQVLKL
jgi:hypothetical protein